MSYSTPSKTEIKINQKRAKQRIVVKVGSSSLASVDLGLDRQKLQAIVEAISSAHDNAEIVLVSSGSIAAGLAPLGFSRRPRSVPALQAAASVGQSFVVRAYQEEFSRFDIRCGLVLLTREDMVNRSHFINVYNTIEYLLSHGVIPIVNENDTVVTEEMRFGDNDQLAMLVAHILDAQKLYLFSDIEQVYSAPPHAGGHPLDTISSWAEVEKIQTDNSSSTASVDDQKVGSGGMGSKINAAATAASNGIETTITSTELIAEVLNDGKVGKSVNPAIPRTVFTPWGTKQTLKKLWLEKLAPVQGTIYVDEGAQQALTQGKSLLSVGITGTDKLFDSGDIVDIALSRTQKTIGRGRTFYSSVDISGMIDIEPIEGGNPVVIHTDHSIIF